MSDQYDIECATPNLPHDADLYIDGHNLTLRKVELLVSRETEALWDRMAERLGVVTFDAAVQGLALIGAAVVTQIDLGYLPPEVAPIDPDKLRSIVWPWLRTRFGQHGGSDAGAD